MSSKARNKEKREELRGEMYAEAKEMRNWPDRWSEAMLRGYDRRKKELIELPATGDSTQG